MAKVRSPSVAYEVGAPDTQRAKLFANGRSQADVMFAALFVLALMALALWFTVDRLLRRAIPWQPDSLLSDKTS